MGTHEMANGKESPYAAIDAKLKAVAATSPVPLPWYDAWTRLGPDSTAEDRLTVYQVIREADSLPDAASFWLVSHLIDDIATRNADSALDGYEDRMRAIEEEYGLEDGSVWPTGTVPAGYDQIREEYYRTWDRVFVQKLEEFGEHGMARLFREDHERFERLSEEGRQYFHGPQTVADLPPMAWLHRLWRPSLGP